MNFIAYTRCICGTQLRFDGPIFVKCTGCWRSYKATNNGYAHQIILDNIVIYDNDKYLNTIIPSNEARLFVANNQ